MSVCEFGWCGDKRFTSTLPQRQWPMVVMLQFIMVSPSVSSQCVCSEYHHICSAVAHDSVSQR
jgi:hypothetical protein